MKNSEGWDGKMRVEPKAVITNPEALEDSDYSDPDAPPVEEIEADEGANTPQEQLPPQNSELMD
jgi:protein phosphatase 1 regulatory subunit 7